MNLKSHVILKVFSLKDVRTDMNLSDKAKIYRNIWTCAYQRRYNAKVKQDWALYDREHETVLMCLNMKDTQWTVFDSDKTFPVK